MTTRGRARPRGVRRLAARAAAHAASTDDARRFQMPCFKMFPCNVVGVRTRLRRASVADPDAQRKPNGVRTSMCWSREETDLLARRTSSIARICANLDGHEVRFRECDARCHASGSGCPKRIRCMRSTPTPSSHVRPTPRRRAACDMDARRQQPLSISRKNEEGRGVPRPSGSTS